MTCKEALRARFKLLRNQLPHSKPPLSPLLPRFSPHKLILSYASFGSELDTWEINRFLADNGKLVLPKITGSTLQLFHVEHLSQLSENAGIREPNPLLCTQVAYSQISLALIPALAFDRNFYRLGYGKGYYDRLLANGRAWTIGLGYREQYTEELPVTATDVPLKELMLH